MEKCEIADTISKILRYEKNVNYKNVKHTQFCMKRYLIFTDNFIIIYKSIEAITDVVKSVIDYRKININELLINLFLRIRKYFILNRGYSTVSLLIYFCYLSYCT